MLAAVAAAVWDRPRSGASPLVLLGLLPAIASLVFIQAGARPLWAAAAWSAWFLLAGVESPRTVLALRRGVIAAACANAILMVAQAAGLDPFFSPLPSFEAENHGAQLITGFLGNSAAAAIFLALCMPLAALLPRRLRLPFQSLLLTAILLAASKLPLLLALTVMLIQMWQEERKRSAMVLVAAVLAAGALYGPLRARTYTGIAEGMVARQLETRLSEWKIAGSILLQRPVWHMAGLGAYGNTERAARENLGLPVPRGHGWFLHAHNDYLETVVEAGWLGALSFAAAFGFWLRDRRPGSMAATSLATFAVLMLAHDPVHRPAALLALAAALAGAATPRETLAPSRRFTTWILAAAALTGAAFMGADVLAAHGRLNVTPANLHWMPEGGRARLVEMARETAQPDAALPLWKAVLSAAPDPEAAMAVGRLEERRHAGSPVPTLCHTWLVTGSIVIENQLRAWDLAPRPACMFAE